MPPAPKSPQAKRAGAPKAKGAVRAKSGCYTCRIRRKKCDEQMTPEGSCQTCVRLRLQCLGFGAKRPDWLRESRTVVDIREKIKAFLASQGMIKGHSGSGPRTSEQEPQILHLSSDYVSPSTSPQTPTLSITSSHEERFSSAYPPGIRVPFDTDRLPVMQDSPDSPGYDSVILPPFTASTPVSLDPSWSSHHSTLALPHPHPHPLHLPRPHTSDFSRWYSYPVPGPVDDDQASDVSSAYLLLPSVSSRHWNFSLDPRQNSALNYYMDNVLRMQYLHADGSLDATIWNLIHSSESAREAACLLSELHRKTREHGRPGVLAPADTVGLHRLLPSNSAANEYEAFAGLCVVSYFLFSGGKGQWQAFLDAACTFSLTLLRTWGGPRRVLLTCSESIRFIIKTSIWFDVLASATLVRTPIMLDVVRELYDPNYSEAWIDDVPMSPYEQFSMMSVMGCENHIVLALAEIAALAAWKDGNQTENKLSVPELVKRGQRIEEILKKPSSDDRERTLAHDECPDQSERTRTRQRGYTSEVFRASAHVYLHSVISGDYPQCPEIIEAVNDTIRCLQAAEGGSTGRSVVRSVVFSICIAGCLTNNVEHKRYLTKRLEEQRGLGNYSQVQYLINEVWRRRGTERVDWRQVMRDAEMLLV